MIELVEGQALFRESHLAVAVGGSYNPTDLVPVYDIANPSLDFCAHQAAYIATGINA